MTLVKFNNDKRVNGYSTFNELFDSVFNQDFINKQPVSKVPSVNVSETEDHFFLELAAPGMKKEDFKINVDKDVLKISAEVKSEETEENKKFNRKEFNYSSFVRSFNLPELIDHSKIDASYADGILNISIAKKEEAKFQSREISVK
ncbi:Hsp20/alpha crystallin family protein [Pedobacter sp. SD-b]|uniref:Hsp20/alpha crystallin family protein n=1 Tax=Pedobacter segetis TaxID=2793069 RepID=A0ABS1BKP0_9SPHI|nr:Hsp20/alpha crystallin family protein [Pedobacter segetis]MBK0383447.1 Hsp20/alpha crystallin family protein [Pedobacter segetis]